MATAKVKITAEVEVELEYTGVSRTGISNEKQYVDALVENREDWIDGLADSAAFDVQDFVPDESEEPTKSEEQPEDDDIPF